MELFEIHESEKYSKLRKLSSQSFERVMNTIREMSVTSVGREGAFQFSRFILQNSLTVVFPKYYSLAHT